MCAGRGAARVEAGLLPPTRGCGRIGSIEPSSCLRELSSDPFVAFSLLAVTVPLPHLNTRSDGREQTASVNRVLVSSGTPADPFSAGAFLSDTAQIQNDDLHFQTNGAANKKVHPNKHCFHDQGKDVAMNFGGTCISLPLSTLDG